jgi:hypothetical protein
MEKQQIKTSRLVWISGSPRALNIFAPTIIRIDADNPSCAKQSA